MPLAASQVSDIRARSLLEAARIALAGGLDELLLWVPGEGLSHGDRRSSHCQHLWCQASSLLVARTYSITTCDITACPMVAADGVPVPHQNSSKSEHAPVPPPMSDVVHDQDCTVQLPAAKWVPCIINLRI